jgi:hypothetical protein
MQQVVAQLQESRVDIYLCFQEELQLEKLIPFSLPAAEDPI